MTRKRTFLPGVAGVDVPQTDVELPMGAEEGNGPLAGLTTNFSLNLTNFDWITWHNYEWDNWNTVDALLNVAIGFLNIVGVWRPQTDYIAGQTVFDPTDLNVYWLCQITHTSGTQFDQAEKDAYWSLRQDANPPVTSVHSRIGDVVGMEGDYAAFYPTIADLEDHENNLENPHEVQYGQLLNIPGEFPPSAHTHPWDQVTNKPTEYPPEAHQHVEADITDLDRIRPRGDFVLGTQYLKNDQALQSGYMGVAKVDTEDNLAPLPQGEAAFVYDGASPTSPLTAKSLLVGTEYTFPEAFMMKRYRLYTVTGNEYIVYYNVDGGVTQTLISFTASSTGWLEQATNEPIVKAGSVLNLGVVVREPNPTPTEFTLSYNYVKPTNPAVPVAGEITHSTKSLDVLDVNKTDQNGDQSAQLATMTIGDIIETGGTRWSISAIVDNGTYYSFTVAPASQAAGIGVMDFDFETVTATPITTVIDDDYFLGDANVQPFYIIDNGVRVNTDDALGIDIELQSVIISPDWFIYAVSSSNASSGGEGGEGVTTYLGLSDTPASFVGQHFKVPRVDEFTGSGQLVFDDFTNYFVPNTGGTFTKPVNFNNAGQDQIRLNNLSISQPFAHILRATADGDFGVSHGDTNTLGGIIESPNDNLKDGLSLVTREKGDNRYLKAIDSGAVDFDTLVPPSTQVQNYRITAVPTANGYPGAGIGDWMTAYAYSGTAARQVVQNWNNGDNNGLYFRDKISGVWGEWIGIDGGGGWENYDGQKTYEVLWNGATDGNITEFMSTDVLAELDPDYDYRILGEDTVTNSQSNMYARASFPSTGLKNSASAINLAETTAKTWWLDLIDLQQPKLNWHLTTSIQTHTEFNQLVAEAPTVLGWQMTNSRFMSGGRMYLLRKKR